jgi:hypothetical protein
MSCSYWTPSHDTVMLGDQYASGDLTGRVWRA